MDVAQLTLIYLTIVDVKGEVSSFLLAFIFFDFFILIFFCNFFNRIKSGNPGYFVAINPTKENVVADFSAYGLPEKMTVDFVSANFNTTGVALK